MGLTKAGYGPNWVESHTKIAIQSLYGRCGFQNLSNASSPTYLGPFGIKNLFSSAHNGHKLCPFRASVLSTRVRVLFLRSDMSNCWDDVNETRAIAKRSLS